MEVWGNRHFGTDIGVWANWHWKHGANEHQKKWTHLGKWALGANKHQGRIRQIGTLGQMGMLGTKTNGDLGNRHFGTDGHFGK